MKVVKRGIVPDARYRHNGGMNIQIEDWSEDYSCFAPADTLAAYPIAKESLPSIWCGYYPEKGYTFRLELRFSSKEETERAFDDLVNKRTTLSDYKQNIANKKYADCI